MGEDLIYTYRRMIPHMFIAIIGCVLGMAIILSFSSGISTTLFWALFVTVWCCMFIALAFEAYRATRIIKGSIEGLPTTDIAHALYWLSIICSGNALFSMGGINYWENVSHVVNKIGGEYKATWQDILEQYKMPSSKKLYAAASSAILSMLGVFATFFFLKELEFKMIAVGAIFAVLIALLYLTGSQLKAVKLVASDPHVTEFARALVQITIAWVSDRTAAPVRVVLAGEAFGAQPVDSLYGQIIAEIKPKSITPQSIETQPSRSLETEKILKKHAEESVIRRRIAYISAHIIVGAVTGFLIYTSFQSILTGDADAGHFIVAILSIGFFALGQYFVYALTPELKVMFQGGKATPSDLRMILERSSKGRLQSRYAGDADFKQKVDFMFLFARQKSVELSDLSEPVKLWLREDMKQPEEFRYFIIEANKVTLTGHGEMLAETVRKKASNIDKLSRQLEELQERARSLGNI
jgi:hypothetical protein